MRKKQPEIKTFHLVMWRGIECIVTNGQVCNGMKAKISPTGNRNNPAKYFTVYKDELTLVK